MAAPQFFVSPETMARLGMTRNAPRLSSEQVAAVQNSFRQQAMRSALARASGPVYTPQDQAPAFNDAMTDPATFDPSAAYDMTGAAGPYIDSRTGGIPGRVVRLKQTSQAIEDEPPEGTPYEQSVAFNQDDQEVLGSTGRRLVGIIGYVNVFGDLPTGYDSASLIQAVRELVKVQVLVSGQVKDETPLTLARDTGFSDRILRLNVILDPGAFNTTRLQFTSDEAELPPAPADGSYTVRIGAQCIFAPLSRQQRAMAARAYDQL